MAMWSLNRCLGDYECKPVKTSNVNKHERKIVKIFRRLNRTPNFGEKELDIAEINIRIDQILDLLQYLKFRPDYVCNICHRTRHNLNLSTRDYGGVDYADNIQKILCKLLQMLLINRNLPVESFTRIMIESFGYAPMLKSSIFFKSSIPFLFGEELEEEELDFFLENANSSRFQLPILTERLNEYLLRNMQFALGDKNALSSSMVYRILKFGIDDTTAQSLFTKFAIDFIYHNIFGEYRIPFDDEYYEKRNLDDESESDSEDESECDSEDDIEGDWEDIEDEEDKELFELAFLRDWEKSMKYILRSSKFLSLADMEEALEKYVVLWWMEETSKDSGDLLKYLTERKDLKVIECRLKLRVTRLDHLCRCNIRDTLYRNWALPEGINKLGIPEDLKKYLNLETD